jgi:hypothetical protein
MKDQFLKLAGVKNEKEFYKLFPTEDVFMAKYGKQVKKLNLGDSLGKLAGSNAFAAGVQSFGDVVGGIQQMKDEKDKLAIAEQMKGVSDVSLQASMLKPEPVQRRYVRPEDNVNTGEAFFPVFGTGTTFAKNGGEITNTFAPNTIYTDLEEAYEGFKLPKINTNPDFMKQATGKNAAPGDVSDIFDFAQQGGGEMLTSMTAGLGSPKGYGQSGAGKMGKGIGTAAGSIFFGPVGGMVGGAVGQLAGNLLDRKAEKTQDFNEATMANIDKMALGQGAKALQQQNYSYMRTGGNIRQNQMAMGGDLKVYRGEAEPMSYNPYLPNDGQTVMFRGPSHDDGGMPIEYGNNPVEVEGGEPAVQLRDGSSGGSNLTVYGNLKIPSFGVEMLGDPKAKGKKFKNYVADLSKLEQRQNNIMDKSVTALDDLQPTNSFDKLSFDSYQANMLGANMKLKDVADKKIKASSLQSAINDTADQFNLVADDLAKGKVKQAKMGSKIPKAQTGETISPEDYQTAMKLYDEGKTEEFQKLGMSLLPKFVESLGTPTISKRFDDNIKGSRTKKLKEYMTRLSQQSSPTQPTLESIAAGIPGTSMEDIQSRIGSDMAGLESFYTETADEVPGAETKNKFDWMTYANQILPYLRPTNAEQLDPRQLSGEMYALSTNQVEPVRAQTFQPELSTPYDISLQDQINANQSDYRAAQRMMGYNPAAQGMLNAQKYQANQQVLGEQFRMNQAMKDRVYGENRQLLDQAKLQNLGILDQQYGRQQEALSKTKETTQAAINSISAKYAQNQLENRTLQTYENMYNYRFDPRMRAMNMNPLAQFPTDVTGASAQEDPVSTEIKRQVKERLDASGLPAGKTITTETKQKPKTSTSRNGSLVKAIKSM